MDKFDRIFQLHAILSSRRTPIPLEELTARLECSKSTLHRAINTLKDHLNAPVVFDAEAGGYKYGQPEAGGTYELPGLWFTEHELQALAIMQRLLKDAGGGLLGEHLSPLAKRSLSPRTASSAARPTSSRCCASRPSARAGWRTSSGTRSSRGGGSRMDRTSSRFRIGSRGSS